MFVFDNLVGAVGKVAEKYLTNQGDKEKFLSELKNSEAELTKISIVQDHEEQQSRFNLIGRLIEKGCIPMLFYLLGLVIFNNCIIAPYVAYFGCRPLPILDLTPDYYSLMKVVVASLFVKKGATGVVKLQNIGKK